MSSVTRSFDNARPLASIAIPNGTKNRAAEPVPSAALIREIRQHKEDFARAR
jgi:hypothetical protein